MKPRYNLAIRSAQRVLHSAGIVEPPVDVDDIARRLGIIVRYSPLEGGYSGTAIRRANGEAIIGVNSTHPEKRQRFSVAHELGHVLLHRDAAFHLDDRAIIGFRSEESSLGKDPREVEANQFAAELLMPEAFIRRDLHRLNDQPIDDVIEELASSYGVSVQAMTIRISRFTNLVL